MEGERNGGGGGGRNFFFPKFLKLKSSLRWLPTVLGLCRGNFVYVRD
jgi:hypothetical protein